jgi:sugar O-acyltransferase (sialic acid O-acetyltransferase NeuD family)
MKDIIIIGSGGHSRSVISIIKAAKKWRKISIIDTQYSGNIEKILSFPVVGGMEFLDTVNISTTDIFIAIGDNILRRDMINLIIKKGFTIPNLVHSDSTLDQDIELGYGNFIGAAANLGPNVKIGNGNIINTLVNIDHETKIGNYNQLAPSSVVCGRSTIGSLVFLGANATIIDGLKVSDKTIIGAGAVVISNIENSGMTFVGIPAKKK